MTTPRPARPPHTHRAETRWGLKAKLILSMLFVGIVPLVIGLGMAFWQGSQEIRDVNGESLRRLQPRPLANLTSSPLKKWPALPASRMILQSFRSWNDAGTAPRHCPLDWETSPTPNRPHIG